MNQSEIFERRNQLFLPVVPWLRGGVILGLLLGVGCFAGGMLQGEHARTWGSFIFNLMYFFSLAVGGVAFGHMQDVIGAKWGRPIKRLHESFGAYLPFSILCFLFLFVSMKTGFLNGHEVYKWVADPKILHHFPGKDRWLQVDGMIMRDIFSLLVLLLLVGWHMKLTLAPDMALLRGDKSEAFRLGMLAKDKLRFWSAPVMFVYSLAFSMVCFDVTMSLAPTWFSTLWAGWSFALMMHILLASLLVFMFMLKGTAIGEFISRQQFHDVGKLMHGFTAFFAYLTYSHILTYWYTNMPEETSYLLTRMEKPWIYFAEAVFVLAFLFPIFALVPKANKWTASTTLPICFSILTAQWITYFLVVIPETVAPAKWSFPWIELGLFCGFFASFVGILALFGSKVPMVSVADPLLPAALSKDH